VPGRAVHRSWSAGPFFLWPLATGQTTRTEACFTFQLSPLQQTDFCLSGRHSSRSLSVTFRSSDEPRFALAVCKRCIHGRPQETLFPESGLRASNSGFVCCGVDSKQNMLSVPLVAESVPEVAARGPSASRLIGSPAPCSAQRDFTPLAECVCTWFLNMVCTDPSSFEHTDFRLRSLARRPTAELRELVTEMMGEDSP